MVEKEKVSIQELSARKNEHVSIHFRFVMVFLHSKLYEKETLAIGKTKLKLSFTVSAKRDFNFGSPF